RLQLHVVEIQALGDVLERHRIADLRLTGTAEAGDLGTDAEILGGQDVALGAVSVVHQRDAAVAVRIVFDADHGADDVDLAALEVDHAVEARVAITLVPDRDPTGAVTPGAEVDLLEKAL